MQRRNLKVSVLSLVTLVLLALSLAAVPVAGKERARDLGIPFDGVPGQHNAITDVPGVEVGHATVIEGEGLLRVGHGPARTGVTIIHPLGKNSVDGVAAGRFDINGTGEWTGMHLVDEAGLFLGPVALTGSGNVGLVIQSLMDWSVAHVPAELLMSRVLPVVGETLDSRLNDVFGHPVSREDVFAALDNAAGGPIAEGNVGGGTGMVAYGFKGGIGTSSRVVEVNGQRYTVGILLQANHGARDDLRIAGIPVGREIQGAWPEKEGLPLSGPHAGKPGEKNSLLIVIATDAPLMPHQLERMARRAAMGVGRGGSTAGNLSGEMALAFSTTHVVTPAGERRMTSLIADTDSATMDALFAAVVQATEESLVNQLIASESMTGANNLTVHALPTDQLVEILARHNRLVPQNRR